MSNVLRTVATIAVVESVAVALVFGTAAIARADETGYAYPADVSCSDITCTLTLPTCEYEDGNSDGLPCFWIHPRTGHVYHVTSDNYDQPNH